MTQPQHPQAKYRHDYHTPDYTITDIDLNFELDPTVTTVTAISHIVRLADQNVPLVLNGESLTLSSIAIDGQSWSDYQVTNDSLIINNLPEKNTFVLTIINTIHPAENSALEGLYQSGDALCTQCEAEGFRHITYYLDRPDVLARFKTRIAADKSRYPYLLSNGNCIESGSTDNGRHWVQWQDPFPKPCYLFALVAGDFDVLHDTFITHSGRSVKLELFVDRGNLDRASWAMTSLKRAMKWDEQRFGLEYDLDIYMVVAVDFFNMGAMENKGLNIFNSKYVLANDQTATDKDYLSIESVIGHEYFHNWTGNRVTCRDWFQLSLKEGLTVFRDQEFSSDLGSRAVNRIDAVRVMRGAQFSEDASPMAHPIRPDKVIEMNNFYTLTVYEKGAEVIRMMHTLLGEEGFQAGMRLYFERFDGKAVTCDDFVQAMEDASGKDLTQFRRWYGQSGTPVLTIRDHYDVQTKQYTLHISQNTPPTADQPEKQALHIPLDIELYAPSGEVIPLISGGQPIDHVLNVLQMEQSFVFDHIEQPPVVALLQSFSAPVKLDYPYTDAQLTFLMQHARSEFTRWDAAQMLLAKYIRLNVTHYHQGKPVSLPEMVVDAFRAILLSETLDPALAAQILTLPSEVEVAELFDIIDPEANHAVLSQLQHIFARDMADEFLAVYKTNQLSVYRVEHEDIARRSLCNVCLHYLALGDADLADKIISKHYWQANNMTDTIAALTAASQAGLACRDQLLQDYDNRWHQDGLVMDKWFRIQATRNDKDTLTTVKQLLNHRSFSLSNPNRTYSLIRTFANGNPYHFHAKDGSGYRLLADILMDLNQRNPQVAAILLDPLIRLKRYDNERQALMRKVLEQLLALDNLSNDLYEKISKALAA